MLNIKIDDVEYSLKQNLKDISIKEYFDIMKVYSKRCEIPVDDKDKYLDGTYEIKYYERKDEPLHFKWQIDNEIINILSGIPIDILTEHQEISQELVSYIDILEDTSEVWNSKRVTKIITKKEQVIIDGKKKFKMFDEIVETDYNWVYDEPKDWTFQQWVDAENASKQHLSYPFILSLYKQKVGSKSKRLYSRAHTDFDDKQEYWFNVSAYGNINTVIGILNKISEVRKLFYWIYEAQSQFPSEDKPTQKIYNEFAGWNDVVVSLSETNAFNSSKGTLHAVRTSNCIEVLEFLNWKRGKAFAEYEDYKIDERNSKFQNVIG